MNSTPTESLKSYLDELEKLLKRRAELSDAEPSLDSDIEQITSYDNERKEVTRLLSYYKIILAKKVLDL